MGSCLSKKSPISSSPSALPDPPDQSKLNTEVEKKKAEEETLKKEIFIIKHRKSHDTDRRSEEEKSRVDQKVSCTTASITTSNTTCEAAEIGDNSISSKVMNGGLASGGGIVVRTSSCTKEEVDAILIQCGRLSRSSSTGNAALSGSGGSCDTGSDPHRSRKYSGSKRSYDFDHEKINCDRDSDKRKGNGAEYDDNVVGGDDDEIVAAERINRHRQRQRQSRTSSSPHGRRRTPSRERDLQQLQRSGSRERGSSGGSGGGRRVSRSPGRRSESPITPNGVTSATPSSANASSNRPGKMVSVPATVSSLAMDKSNNGGGGGGGGGCGGGGAEPPTAAAIKRISVRRNAGDPAMGSRTVASPRSRSPARANVRASNENQNAHTNQYQHQPLSLSRSNSRKAEQSPYRRNPLSEIDQNSLRLEQPSNKNASNNNILPQTPMQKPNVENVSNNKDVVQGPPDKVVAVNLRAKEQRPPIVEEAKVLQPITRDITVTAAASGDESLKPQTLTRTRSSRRSRDLDINPEALLNPTPSYTTLLLEDIQNFHQKNTTSFSLPACVTKACSILEAVADLNSSTSFNLSCALSDDRRRNYIPEQFKNDDNFSSGANPVVKKRLETKEPFLESEVVVTDDLMEPSLHKYVTVRRGAVGKGDMEEQESSGSNSFVGGQQYSVSSSWEPNSADSTDCWTSSRSNAREEQRHALSESGRGLCGKKKESDCQQIGIGRGRVGSSRGLHTLPVAAAAST